ncbi:MAG TPA: response regulator [Candidatus Lustribacter sp.]|jgi:PleD family two-component response regulator|nr:response regulator [Candidatus Lustribacter sp.]
MSPSAAPEAHRPTVLVVDDDKVLRRIIGTNLELGGFDVLSAPDGPSALALLDDHLPDVVVLDVVMPLMDGYATLGRIRRHATASHIPVIVLTGAGPDSNDSVKSLEAGADDFIAKPFSPQEMLARVRAKVRRANVDSSLQPLTRLPGNIAIEHEVRRRFEEREPWAVIYADLDNFKAFNDHYGFVRGDDAIRLVATAMTESIKRVGSESDFLGHIGGDDFIIVTTPQRAETLARNVADTFDRDVPPLYDPADRARGWIAAKDRRGNNVRFPMMSLSLAIVMPSSRITSYQSIGEVAAELKSYAKRQTGSFVAMDKRSR